MRICVLQSSYSDTSHALESVDTDLPDPSQFTTQHIFEQRLIHKVTAKQELDAIAAEGFDFFFNFMWGSRADSVAGVEASEYFESLGLPHVGLKSRILSRSKKDFYKTAEALGAPRVPGNSGWPKFVKPASGCASLHIDEKSICHNQTELEVAVARLSKLLAPGREEQAKSSTGRGEVLTNGYHDVSVPSDIVVQEFIPGDDYTVTVIEMNNTPVALVPCAVRYKSSLPKNERFLTFEAKFDDDTRLELLSEDTPELSRELKETAVAAYKANEIAGSGMGCDVDIRVKPDGTAVAIEVNPMPAAFLPKEHKYADLPIIECFPGGHRALINVFIANYYLQQKSHLDLIEKVAEQYDIMSIKYDDICTSTNVPSIVQRLINEHDFSGTVADLASGTGLFGRLLAASNKPKNDTARHNAVYGIEISPGMRGKCLTGYTSIAIGAMQDVITAWPSSVDHIVCFAAIHFLTTYEFDVVMCRAFQLARKSITMTVDEIPERYNQHLREKELGFMEGWNHIEELDAFGVPKGWRVVSRWRASSWVSPKTGDEIWTTAVRFERGEESGVYGSGKGEIPVVSEMDEKAETLARNKGVASVRGMFSAIYKRTIKLWNKVF